MYCLLTADTIFSTSQIIANARLNIVWKTQPSAAIWHSTENVSDEHIQYSIVERMTFILNHIFPNPRFLFVSGLNCMSLNYKFHLIDHMCCSSIIITHML